MSKTKETQTKLKDVKDKLAKFVDLAEDDVDYQKYGKDFAKDIYDHEEAAELLKNPFYASIVKELEEGNQKTKDAIVLCDLLKTSNETIRQVIADYQANNRTINTLKGKALEDIEAQLDRAIKAIEEAREESKQTA